MIVDLMRNDLARVCTTGSVQVRDLFRVSTFPSGHQMISAVEGRLRPECDAKRHATVTICHSKTKDLDEVCHRADVVGIAAGVCGVIGAPAVRPGATVIDVGAHRVNGRLRGDVGHDELADVAGLLTPVAAGVGPMTIAMLLSNTLQAESFQFVAAARRIGAPS